MLRGVIFDFDGVIVDSHAVHIRAWQKFLETMGRIACEEELQFVLDGRKRDDILRHFLGEIDCDRLTELGHRKEQLFREEAAYVQTVGGLLGFLENLVEEHVALGIASSGSRTRVDFLLDRLGLKRHFRVVVTGDEVEQGKPDPAVFLRAAQEMALDPAELLVFEDALSGVKAARSAGMICVGIAPADRTSILLNAGADHVLPDFRGLSYSKIQELFDEWSTLKSDGLPS